MVLSPRLLGVLVTLVAALGLSHTAAADQRLATTVSTSAVFANTERNTPPIFDVWTSSSPCVSDVHLNTDWPNLANAWKNVPLPCYFNVADGNDGEAVLRDHGYTNGHERTYEFWASGWNGSQGWNAYWGGAADNSTFVQTPYGRAWAKPDGADYGVQASGLAFTPGLITVEDLASGVIAHAVHMEVPTSCTTWVWPATRTDRGASYPGTNDCYQYGTAYKLPADYMIPASWPHVIRMMTQAAKDYGFVITDANHYGVGFRFENWKRPWSSWGAGSEPVNPYYDPSHPELNYFECPASGWSWRCVFDQNNLAWYWGQKNSPYNPNAQTFWEALVQVNP